MDRADCGFVCSCIWWFEVVLFVAELVSDLPSPKMDMTRGEFLSKLCPPESAMQYYYEFTLFVSTVRKAGL